MFIEIGEFLNLRLKQMGIQHLFGVPGDFNLQNGWFYVWLELLGFVCTGEYGRTECDWYFYSVLVARNSDMADRSIFLYFN